MEQTSFSSEGSVAKRQLIIVDDHPVVARGLKRLLDQAYAIVGVAASGADLGALLSTTSADCLLLDLALGDSFGLNLLGAIRTAQPNLHVVVLTIYKDRAIAEACLRDGADAFVPKEADLEELIAAIEAALSGRKYISKLVPKTSHGVGNGAYHPALWRLTRREQDTVRLLGRGMRPAQIARYLGVSRSNVTLHKKNAMRLLGIRADSELLRYAVLVAGSDLGVNSPDRD